MFNLGKEILDMSMFIHLWQHCVPEKLFTYVRAYQDVHPLFAQLVLSKVPHTEHDRELRVFAKPKGRFLCHVLNTG